MPIGVPTALLLPKKLYDLEPSVGMKVTLSRKYVVNNSDGTKVDNDLFGDGKIDFVKITEAMILTDSYPEMNDDEVFCISDITITDTLLTINGRVVKYGEPKEVIENVEPELIN